MSYEQIVCVIDANGVRSSRVQPNIEVLQDEGFLVQDQIKMEITEAQAEALTSRDVEPRDFLTGPVVALLLKRANAYETMMTVKTELDDVYTSSDSWSTLRDSTIFFPTKPQLERTVVIIKPAYSHAEYTSILELIDQAGFNVIGKLARILTPDMAKEIIGDNSEAIEYCTNDLSVALVLEKIGAIDEWQLLMGPEDVDLAKDIAPNSIRAMYGKDNLHNAVYGSESPEKASKDLSILFPSPFAMERTLAIIKPDAFPYKDDIMAVIEANGLAVLAESTMTLSSDRAAQFFTEHKERTFFDALCKYMSSGPITVLCLGKPCAVNAWKKLVGAEDLSTGGLRALYGADSLRNGFHASEDPEVAVNEINFFFPQLSVEKIPNLLEVEDLLNKKPAPRPHVEPKKSLNDVLVEGLTQLCRIKPVGNDAIEWLGEWLLRNNPNKSNADVPEEATAAPTVSEIVSAAADGVKPSILWAVGGPGSGKEEYCKEIVDKYGYEYIHVDTVLDAAETSGNEYGELIKECKKSRKPIPSQVVVSLIKSVITNSSGKANFLINGFPNSLDGAFSFESDIAAVDKIIYFDCSKQARVQRSEASGVVDSVEKIEAADKVFMETIAPVIDHFNVYKKVKKVSTNGTDAQISARISKALS